MRTDHSIGSPVASSQEQLIQYLMTKFTWKTLLFPSSANKLACPDKASALQLSLYSTLKDTAADPDFT